LIDESANRCRFYQRLYLYLYIMHIQFQVHNGNYTNVTATAVSTESEPVTITLSWDINTYYDIFHDDTWDVPTITSISEIASERPTVMTRVSSKVAGKQISIVGELQLYSTYIFKTDTSTPVYLFRPLDYHLPSFYVHSNMKKKYASNVWISIDYLSWDKTNKFPKGATRECFGPVADHASMENALFHHTQLYRQPLKCPDWVLPSSSTQPPPKQTERSKPIPFKKPIISIDPDGCRDIDDAFSFEHDEGTGRTVLWIHISDVLHNTNWNRWGITLESLISLPRSTSVYMKKSIVPMLPTIWSSNMASLLQGEVRNMITLEVEWMPSMPLQYRFISTRGKITKNETYDSYQMSDALQRTVSTIYADTVSSYSNMETMRDFHIVDTHTLIEAMMIIYNVHFGHHVKNSIIRTQRPSSVTMKGSMCDSIDNTMDTDLSNYLRITRMNKAVYSLESSSDGYTSHASLGLLRYTHASSPIRRSIDLLNQYIYYYGLNSSGDNPIVISQYLESVNRYEKMLRAFYRKLNVIDMANNIADTDGPIDTYIVSANTEKNRMTLYIPSRSISIRVPIVHPKLRELYTLSMEDTMTERHPVILLNPISDKTQEKPRRLPMFKHIPTRYYGKPNLFAIDDSLHFTMDMDA